MFPGESPALIFCHRTVPASIAAACLVLFVRLTSSSVSGKPNSRQSSNTALTIIPIPSVFGLNFVLPLTLQVLKTELLNKNIDGAIVFIPPRMMADEPDAWFRSNLELFGLVTLKGNDSLSSLFHEDPEKPYVVVIEQCALHQ